jgi:hypothetical protein
MRHRHRTLLILAAAVIHYGCGPEPETATETIDDSIGDPIDVPAGPGSQSPNLAVGPGGRVVLSWLEPDEQEHKLQYSLLEDANWSTPVSVARGDNWFVNWADFPSVVPISESLWAAHWLVRQPAGGYAYDVFLSASSDGGSTWSDPVRPHDDGTPTEHGFVSLYPQSGGIGLVWLDGRNTAADAPPDLSAYGMTLRSARYSGDLTISDEAVVDEFICDCCQTDVAVTGESYAAVYRDRTSDETRDIYVARYVGGKWQPGRAVAEDGWVIGGCPVNGPVIEAEGQRLAVAWFTAAQDESRVQLARSNDNGETFLAPVDVTDNETFGRVGLAMLDDGDAAVSWLCKQSDDRARVCVRLVTAANELGPVHVLSGDHQVSPLSVPQIARNRDDLLAAWTVRRADGTDIVSRRVPIESLR